MRINLDLLSSSDIAALDNITKRCTSCGETFPVSQFPVTSARGQTVIRSWCKTCMKSYYRGVARRRQERASNAPQ